MTWRLFEASTPTCFSSTARLTKTRASRNSTITRYVQKAVPEFIICYQGQGYERQVGVNLASLERKVERFDEKSSQLCKPRRDARAAQKVPLLRPKLL